MGFLLLARRQIAKMKTTIIAVSDDGTSRTLAHFEGGPVTSLSEARLLAAGPGVQSEKRVTNSRKVLIVAVSEDAYRLKVGDVISSAAELSRIFGYNYPKVSQALMAAEAVGEHTAVIHGVEFQYAD